MRSRGYALCCEFQCVHGIIARRWNVTLLSGTSSYFHPEQGSLQAIGATSTRRRRVAHLAGGLGGTPEDPRTALPAQGPPEAKICDMHN